MCIRDSQRGGDFPKDRPISLIAEIGVYTIRFLRAPRNTNISDHRGLEHFVSDEAGEFDSLHRRISVLHPKANPRHKRVTNNMIGRYAKLSKHNVELLSDIHIDVRERYDRVVVSSGSNGYGFITILFSTCEQTLFSFRSFTANLENAGVLFIIAASLND